MFKVGDSVQDTHSGVVGSVTSVDTFGNILHVNHPPYASYTTAGPSWVLYYPPPPPGQVITKYLNSLPVNANIKESLEPLDALLKSVGAQFHEDYRSQCNICKEIGEIVLTYQPFRVTRQICRECMIRKIDSIFGIAGVDPKTEKVLYGNKT